MAASRRLNVGDPCFAKVKGWIPYPARIVGKKVNTKSKKIIFEVIFFETKETGNIGSENVWEITSGTLKKFVTPKTLSREIFKLAFDEMKELHVIVKETEEIVQKEGAKGSTGEVGPADLMKGEDVVDEVEVAEGESDDLDMEFPLEFDDIFGNVTYTKSQSRKSAQEIECLPEVTSGQTDGEMSATLVPGVKERSMEISGQGGEEVSNVEVAARDISGLDVSEQQMGSMGVAGVDEAFEEMNSMEFVRVNEAEVDSDVEMLGLDVEGFVVNKSLVCKDSNEVFADSRDLMDHFFDHVSTKLDNM